MLEQFPGRFLHEIDEMDWPRYLRAMEAQAMIEVEDQRTNQINGLVKGDDIKPEIWERIKEHDEIMAEAESD